MNLKKTLIGAGLGFAAGCTLGVARTGVTLFAPWAWIPGNAATFGLLTYQLSGENLPLTVAASAAGAAVGVAELVCYPVTASLSLAEAAALPAIGTVVGAVVANS